MSFLQFPRLAFSGLFQADVSTVNNDPRHFDNANFQPNFQEPQSGTTFNGWWNPFGTGIFGLKDCVVQSALGQDGTEISNGSSDQVVGMAVGNALNRPSGKLVDLDPDWQLASCIYGQGITLTASNGQVIFSAEYEANPFRDLWFTRTQKQSADSAASAMFQSILTNVQWNLNGITSPVLQALMAISQANNNTLSIRLTTYGYDANLGDNFFGYGVLVGAIGPAYEYEPHSFILGRRFMPFGSPSAANINTNGYENPNNNPPAITCFSSAVVGNTLQADLSNALPMTYTPQATLPASYSVLSMNDQKSTCYFALLTNPAAQMSTMISSDEYILLDPVDFNNDLLSTKGGIQSVSLKSCASQQINDLPFAIISIAEKQTDAFVIVREGKEGLEVRADQFTFRLDPNDPARNAATSTIYAARYGVPLPGKAMAFWPTGPLPDNGDTPTDYPPQTTPKAAVPINNVPANALSITTNNAVTDEHGRVTACVQGPSYMGTPRQYLDGQLYTYSYNFAGDVTTLQQQFDQFAILVFSTFQIPNPVTWESVQPILQQYANLYPVMSQGLFDFSKKEQADANAFILKFVLDKDINDPDQMPVTRDLSSSKRAALIQYLDSVLQSVGRPPSMLEMFGKRCPTRGGGAQPACPHAGNAAGASQPGNKDCPVK